MTDPTSEERAEADIPLLTSFFRELRDLVQSALEGRALESDTHLGFMAFTFLSTQLEHATGVLTLGDHPDTQLIARSMLEGRCQLLWAVQDPATRPLMWRQFAWIVDWRKIRAREEANENVDETRREAISQQLDEFGAKFYRGKVKNHATKDGSDPFHREWHLLPTVRDLFKQTDSMVLYTAKYVPLSEWHHWSPAGLGLALSHNSGSFVYNARSAINHAIALTCAFQCLHDTASVADFALGLSLAEPLQSISDRYLTRTVQSS